MVYDVDVAPMMLFHVDPPSMLSCHCTEDDGLAVDDAVNVAVDGILTVWDIGWIEMIGAYCTVNIAALVLVDP